MHSDFSVPAPSLQSRAHSRSIGLKLLIVCALGLLMLIPGLFVQSLLQDRTERAAQVAREISSHVGGQQTFLGPTLVIPYTLPGSTPAATIRRGLYFVFPANASAAIATQTEERRRSLFKVPVFRARLKLDATFDLSDVPAALPQSAELDWSRAEIVVGASDARGALTDATLSTSGRTFTLTPAVVADQLSLGADQNHQLGLKLFGTPVGDIATAGARFSVSSELQFSGAQRIALLAYAKSTQLFMVGDWPDPGFDGAFLPATRTTSSKGFSAEWSVPFLARGVRAEGPLASINGLDATATGVSFIEVADPYQSVNRAYKYMALFLGLVFLSYFVFEVTIGKRVHPAQYILVGIAQMIFYLLLLSFAERLGFDLAFLVAGLATVLLLSSNAAWIFVSRLQGVRALAVFSSVYALIYMLLRLEDNALLLGAIASFVAVAAAMYFTRGIDWYSSLPSRTTPQQGS